ncbi:MAG: MFS transporter [Clostridia bacterium]|nr:MFS transporter [Clostridia bacterium]
MKIKELLRRNDDLVKDEDQRDRQLFIYESCVGGTIYNLTTGAFMAGLAVSLGASDWLNGLLGVIPMMAGMVQILAPLLLERSSNKKFLMVFFVSLYKLMISSVVFIPLVISNQNGRLTVLMVCVVAAYFSLNIVWPGFSMWMQGVVPERIRGRFFGIKDSYALAVITAVSLTMGYVLDAHKPQGSDTPAYTGFLIVFLVALGLTLINIGILLRIKEPKMETSVNRVKLSDCFTKPLANKTYMKVVLFFILWNLGLNIGNPFLPVYQVKYLQLDYKYIMLLNLLSNITIVFVVRQWGKYADRFTWAHSATLSIGILSFTHLLWVFASEKTLFLLPVIFLLNGTAWAGINISLFNLPFLFSPQENRTVYLGFNAALGGISGLAATLLGGQLVNLFEGKVFIIGNVGLSGIQIIIFISSILLAVCTCFGVFRLIKMLHEQTATVN